MGIYAAKDVFEIKRVEEESRESEESYRSLIQMLPDIVYRIDKDGCFMFINNSIQSLDYTPENLIGKHFSEIIHPEDVESVTRYSVLSKYAGKVTGDEKAPKIFDERRTGKRITKNLEVRILRNNSAHKAAASSFMCGVICEVTTAGWYDRDVKDEEKNFLGSVGIIRDVSAGRKQLEKKLEMVKQVQQDLELGKRIQQTYLTNNSRLQQIFNEVGCKIAAFNYSPETVSGDFYFPKWINKHSAGLFFADACGHGIAADMISIRILSVVEHIRSPVKHASEFLESLNEDIQVLTPAGSFVAAGYLIFNQTKITFSNAGQPCPLVLSDGEVQEIEANGFPLGQIEDVDYQNVSARFSHGDRVIIYTDGITEALNFRGEQYGKDRLVKCIRKNADLPLNGLKDQIVDSVHNFTGGRPIEDDITLLIVEHESCGNGRNNFQRRE